MPELKRKRSNSSSESSSDDECLVTSKLKKSQDKLARRYCINLENPLFGSTSIICDLCDRLFTNRIEALVHNTKHIIIPLMRFKTLGEFYQYHTEEMRQIKPEIKPHKQESMIHHTDGLVYNNEVLQNSEELEHHKSNMECPEESIQHRNEHINQKSIPNEYEMIFNKKEMIIENMHHREDAEEYILPDNFAPDLPVNNLMNNDVMCNLRSRIIFEDEDENIINISDDESVLYKITSDCKVNLGEPMPLNKIVLGKANTQSQNNSKNSQNIQVLETFTSDCKVVLHESLPFSLGDLLTNKTECEPTESKSVLKKLLTSDCKVNLEPMMFDEEIMCDNEPFETAVESLRLEILAFNSLGEERKVLSAMEAHQTFEISDDDEIPNGDATDEYASVHYDELTIPLLHQCKCCLHSFPNKFDLVRHSTRHLRILGPDPRRCLFCCAPPLTVDAKLPICRACLASRRLTLVKTHGAVICAFCQTRFLTVRDLETHLRSHYDDPGKLYFGLLAVCEVCAVFVAKQNYVRRDGYHKFTFVGEIKEVGVKQRCDKCPSSCDTAQLYQKSTPLPAPHSSTKPAPMARKLHFEEQRYRKRNAVKAISNEHRLKNIQNRLKIMKGV